jgi:acetyltransferase-like isoleucine patch superfamily enzyme
MACIVNTAATVDHHCELADGVHLSPGVHLSGNVRIGKMSWLGTGASVRDKISIGENITIGVGSVVVKDIFKVGIYSGVPARMIKDTT